MNTRIHSWDYKTNSKPIHISKSAFIHPVLFTDLYSSDRQNTIVFFHLSKPRTVVCNSHI